MTRKDSVEVLGDLISISEAARVRDVSHAAIQDLIRRGKLSPVEVGGRRFVRRSDVENYQPEPIGRPPKHTTTEKRATSQKQASNGRSAGKKKGKK